MRAISSACATIPAPRPASSFSTRSKTSTSQPRRRSMIAAKRPLIEPPITSARRFVVIGFSGFLKLSLAGKVFYILPTIIGGTPWP